jgi:DNA repair exonuclease SbcCD ATPase subunit
MSEIVTVSSLVAENLYGLSRVELTFDPARRTYLVTGRNGAGKTSLVDAIWFALKGPKGTHRPKEHTIRQGAASGYAELVLSSGVRVRRTAETVDGAVEVRLELSNADGSAIYSPQTFLNRLCWSGLGTDPLRFASAKPEEQANLLLEVSGLDHVVTELDRQRKAAYEERTAVGRDRKRADQALVDFGPLDEDAPAEEVDLASLLAEHSRLVDERSKIERAAAALEDLRASADDVRTRIERLAAELAAEQERLVAIEERIRKGDEWLVAQPAISTADVERQIADADRTNQAVRRNRERARLVSEFVAYDSKYEELSRLIASVEAERVEAIAGARLPHPELELTADNRVLFRGVPLESCSFAQRVEVGCAVAMARDTGVGLVTIEQGTELDNLTLDRIERMAAERGFLLLVQRVAACAGDGAIHLVEGSVLAA